eukprot:TRINITY_DN534_c0_g1_i1.p1 TRINITY_DN534_c0_g1~~TRINITY_DN534_c0_g1_i1.p1  ORF type:complete len:123 (-),score=23.68 TRINITY_DN534_c0_g1_i1:126-494(-)
MPMANFTSVLFVIFVVALTTVVEGKYKERTHHKHEKPQTHHSEHKAHQGHQYQPNTQEDDRGDLVEIEDNIDFKQEIDNGEHNFFPNYGGQFSHEAEEKYNQLMAAQQNADDAAPAEGEDAN